MEVKPTNPKEAFGDDKLPLHLWPNTATLYGVLAFLDGACKYGRSNFRPMGVRASTYYSAAKRHLDAWFEGEDLPKDSKVHHLGHALACIAILIDGMETGNLTDDRNYPGGYLKLVEKLTPLVKQIKEMYAGREVKHYDIRDVNKQEHLAPTITVSPGDTAPTPEVKKPHPAFNGLTELRKWYHQYNTVKYLLNSGKSIPEVEQFMNVKITETNGIFKVEEKPKA